MDQKKMKNLHALLAFVCAVGFVSCVRIAAFKMHPAWVFSMRALCAWMLAYAIDQNPKWMIPLFSVALPLAAWRMDLLDGGTLVYIMISGLLTGWTFIKTGAFHPIPRILATGAMSFLSEALGSVLLILWRGRMTLGNALYYAMTRNARTALALMAGLCIYWFFTKTFRKSR